MNVTGKTIITLMGIAAIGLGGASAYAQSEDALLSQLDRAALKELRQSGDRDAFRYKLNELGIDKPARPQLTDVQRDTLDELKGDGDYEAIKEQLDEWRVKPARDNGKRVKAGYVFQDLTDDQKEELQELRTEGDKEAVRDKLKDLGVELAERPQLTDDQKEKIQELKDSGDKEAVKEYFEELGLKKPRKHMAKRTEVIDSLSDDEKEVLDEARDIARAGDKETAREMIEEIFEDTLNDGDAQKGFFGFFKRLF
ncbi:MAG: hypothetical protein ACJAV6_000624 [Candidatus Paceibacteria bacterium]|jgi:hypothetical protein